MKSYLIKADIGEEYPCYTFMINANNKEKAEKRAKRIIKADYKEQWEYTDIDIKEVKTIADVKSELLV